MENHHFSWVNPLKITIFNSYVKLPEGNSQLVDAFLDHWINCQVFDEGCFFFDERQENLSNVELMNNAGIPGKLAAVATLPAVFR